MHISEGRLLTFFCNILCFIFIVGVIWDEEVLAFLQDGNISDIEELHDEDDVEIDPVLFQDMLDEENDDPVPNEPCIDLEEPATTPGRRQPLLHQTQSSDEVRTENLSNRQSGLWRQSSFTDKDHNYSSLPSGAVKTPSEYIHDYFDEEFFEVIAHCTNTYHLRNNGTELKTNSQEITKLFGLHLLMGVFPYPRLPMYWRMSTKLPLIANHMSRDRFLMLRNSLHVVDTDSPPTPNDNSPPNPLWKVQPIIDRIRDACYKLERVPGFYSIDEQMIPFTGRCALRQVVKNKPRPTGLKIKSGHRYRR